MDKETLKADILVVGAGIAGISTALEAAETGFSVILIEENAYIGGRVAQLNQYFPKLCPPTCGLEINIKRLRDNPLIHLYTLANVEEIKGQIGNYNVKVKIKPTYIRENYDKIEEVIDKCIYERKNDFDFGLSKNKVIYKCFNSAYPDKYILDKSSLSDEELRFLADAFLEAIDLNQKEKEININVTSIIWATGWKPYDATNLENLGYGKYQNVITNMELERLISANGPYGGNPKFNGINKETLESVAFVQCAGSRDENHLEYCSTICCLASIKQSQYIRNLFKDCEIHIYYIDIRTPGVYEEFCTTYTKDDKIYTHRGKVAKVIVNESGLIVEAEDTLSGKLIQRKHDLVVLALGMQPNTQKLKLLMPNSLDKNGFVRTDEQTGIIGCGVCTRPKDVASTVQEATGAAMKAIHQIMGGN